MVASPLIGSTFEEMKGLHPMSLIHEAAQFQHIYDSKL